MLLKFFPFMEDKDTHSGTLGSLFIRRSLALLIVKLKN